MSTAASSRQLRRSQRERLGTQMAFWGAMGMTWAVGVFFWVIYLAIQVVSTFAVARWGEESVDLSISQAAPVFVFVMGILTPASLLTVHVVSGATRRCAIRGYVAAAAVIGLTFAVAQTLFTLLAGWLAGVAGIEMDAGSDPLGMVAGLTVAITIAFLTGVAVAAGYRRLGGALGTLALPVLLAPAALTFWSTGALRGQVSIGVGVTGIGWLAALAGLVIAAGVVWLLLRRIPIR